MGSPYLKCEKYFIVITVLFLFCHLNSGKYENTENICFIILCLRGHLCFSNADSCIVPFANELILKNLSP